MRHVFVETNWVVACAAPAHHKTPAALELLERARLEELMLHVPAISMAEARRPISERYQSRMEAERIRQYLLWARDQKIVTPENEAVVRGVIDQMENRVKADLAKLDQTLQDLGSAKGVDVFDLTQPMLGLCCELSYTKLGLQPFDQAILAAILVRADDLAKEGVTETEFCELDQDLQPWDKKSNPKSLLTELYDARRIWVYGDFLLQSPEKYEGWPSPKP